MSTEIALLFSLSLSVVGWALNNTVLRELRYIVRGLRAAASAGPASTLWTCQFWRDGGAQIIQSQRIQLPSSDNPRHAKLQGARRALQPLYCDNLSCIHESVSDSAAAIGRGTVTGLGGLSGPEAGWLASISLARVVCAPTGATNEKY